MSIDSRLMASIIGDIYWDSSMCWSDPSGDGLEESPLLKVADAESSFAIIASEILPRTEDYESSNVQMIATGHINAVSKLEAQDDYPRADRGKFSCYASYEINGLPANQELIVHIAARRPLFGDSDKSETLVVVPIWRRVITLAAPVSIVRCDFLVQRETS